VIAVMAGLVPAIHVLRDTGKDVDARDKPGHDERRDRGFSKVTHSINPLETILRHQWSDLCPFGDAHDLP